MAYIVDVSGQLTQMVRLDRKCLYLLKSPISSAPRSVFPH